MKRVFIILFYIIILIGFSLPFWNKEYTHKYYGNNVENVTFETYVDKSTGELSAKYYSFDYTNKLGMNLHVKALRVDSNFDWFETELRKGNYYNPNTSSIFIFIFAINIILLFLIAMQYIVYICGESDKIAHCRDCPISYICPFSPVAQNILKNDKYVFLKFYKWFEINFIKFWGYENNS